MSQGSLNTGIRPAPSRMANLTLAPVPDLAGDIPPDLLAMKTFVGAGGFGDVYRLEHPVRGVLAIKQIKESGTAAAIERQRRHARKEAAIWYGLDHCHVLKLGGILEWERNFCFVCPFIKHGSLMEYLQINPMTKLDRVQLIIECLDALSYLHKKDILHGDIKAANLLLSKDLRIQVCDFGLSRFIDVATSTAVTGKGSARWMSPELIDGEPKSFASDVWAVGMTIYEILSGYLPFKQHARDSPIFVDIVAKRKLPPFEPTHSVDGESYAVIWDSVSGCWNYGPAERPSMATLHLGVKTLRQPPPPTPTPVPGLSIRNGIPNAELVGLAVRSGERVVVLSAHLDRVWCVAFSADRQTLASASNDNTVRLWDVARATPLGEPLRGSASSVYSISFSPDGTTLVSGSEDHAIRLWDVTTGQTKGEPLTGHTHSVWSVAFSPDGRAIASGSGDGTIRIWDSGSRSCIAVLKGHTNWVMSVAFSPNGKMLVSGSGDRTARLWDMTRYAQIGAPMEGHDDWVRSVTFAPDGSNLASGSYDSTTRLWDAQSGKPKGSPLKGPISLTFSVAFHPNGRLLASGSWDSIIQIWDLTTASPKIKLELKDQTAAVRSVAFSPDGKWLASGCEDMTIRLWNLEVLLRTI